MAIIVTSSRRRIAMGLMLAAAVVGSVIRYQAPDPSTLRDVGTLLMVMWLPAVGNLVAYVVGKLPARKSPPLVFASDVPFTARLHARIELVALPSGWMELLDPSLRVCTAVMGRRGFTVRSENAVSRWLSNAPATLALECLVPSAALRELVPRAAFHLAVGSTVVARCVVAEHPPAMSK